MRGRPIDQRWAPLLFFAGQLLIMILVLLSIALYDDFNFYDNSLSDLGIADTAPLFNGGLVIGGILSVVFYGSLWISGWKRMDLAARAGALLQPLSLLFMLLVGVFTEAFGPFHLYLAISFFVTILAGTMLLGISMLRDPAVNVLGFFAVVITVLGAAGWLLPRGDGLALPEVLSCLPQFIWMCMVAVKRWNDYPTHGPRSGTKAKAAEEE